MELFGKCSEMFGKRQKIIVSLWGKIYGNLRNLWKFFFLKSLFYASIDCEGIPGVQATV